MAFLSDLQLASILTDWSFWARWSQLPPPGEWRSWVFLGGRGAGKTRAGAEWVTDLVWRRQARRIALVAPTFHDVREVMIEGPSGLRAPLRWRVPTYETSRRRLIWPNGAQAHCFSAEDPAALRGPQFDAAWCDEMCFWSRPDETLATLAHGLRLGRRPRVLVTTTPRPLPALKRLLAASDTVVTRAATWENQANLAPGFIETLNSAWVGDARQRQELLGELIEDLAGALWRRAELERLRAAPDAPFERVVIAVDPPTSIGRNADRCGIVAAATMGEGAARRAVVLADWGGEANPISLVTGTPMIEAMSLWAWDARPHPAFPARGDVWADGAAWRLGHWLNGRAGLSGLAEAVTALCARAGVEGVDASSLVGAVSGYVVDAPASARDALEPLMAAYAFDAMERDGQIVFAHRAIDAPLDLAMEDFAADSPPLFAQRADSADAPAEARLRFLDASRDYRIAGVSARRRDNARDGVESIDAPIVLESLAAEAMAERLLQERWAATETIGVALGPAHLSLEPGDSVTIAGGDAFEVLRIEDAETRRLELRRMRAESAAHVGIADPNAPPTPHVAPTPALAILDLPPLPVAEGDDRPLAAVFASPWLAPHVVYAGASATRRATAAYAATMGELLWPLWPGPIDRWDDGNVVRIRLYGGALSSVTRDALLNGANVFAIEADGEWELVQARRCELVAPGEYELSGFLRGRLGSGHAMRAPHPIGARIVLLDERLVRVDMAAHEWGEALAFAAPPAGRLASDPRAEVQTHVLAHVGVRAWAPAHLRARRVAGGDVELSWVRCARIGGDTWGAAEPLLGASAESYRLEIFDGADVVRVLKVSAPAHLYTAVEQTADFGVLPGSLRFRVAQIGDGGATGLNSQLTITL